ncbi:MAG: glutamate-1-semialdehyde 2,1-aminomutase [Gammaproteobacteria bacterium]|nr:glutamate-1-semialdehyde 2,1-aminomutase [Gammaproteobacteria bacterium]MBT5204075.1 glutamate-1-semialdehyde 2,1-aminomutase [Gammaproteobacteria bacterium]MBT5602861.1 glutamate-1-semialdehyde 2,1-aminomutase [Gammaproteobacteria bacterium]MBT6246269.1 glutamate-1-semialdehyde 2,1-aminomutase [Gammaproteobacteria bacterium]
MNRSKTLFTEAKEILPGGVNSPVRAFSRVGGEPVYFNRGKGAYLFDEDGKAYIDYIGSWGPMIAGHAHPEVISAVQQAAENGLGFGAPTENETTLAKKIRQHMPTMELMRMVNSGTEATMSALRVARGFTGRDKIVKFEGCYHGHSDGLLVKAGSGALTLGEPDSAGVPLPIAEQTLTLAFNDIDALKTLFSSTGEQIAAVIVEPVAGNMGMVLPLPGFLAGLKQICEDYGALLIFDEVMTGFRVGLQGAQGLFSIQPDLTTLGKVIGGGLPVGAFGGRREVMECVAPLGPVYQAGTLSGNPLAMASGIATMSIIEQPDFFPDLEAKTSDFMQRLEVLASDRRVPLATTSLGGMFGFFFSNDKPISNFTQVLNSNTENFNTFFHHMLAAGVNLAPSPFESGFVSGAHTEREFSATLTAADSAFKNI